MGNGERIIKRGFWTDEKISKLSIEARLVYIGLWSMADDFGVVRGNPALLKTMVFPYDALELDKFEFWLNELIDLGRLEPFTVEGESYLFLRKLTTHQRMRRHRKTDNPPPPKSDGTKDYYKKYLKKTGVKVKRRPSTPKEALGDMKPLITPKKAKKVDDKTPKEIYVLYLKAIKPKGKGSLTNALNNISKLLLVYKAADLKGAVENYSKRIGDTIPQFRRVPESFFCPTEGFFSTYLPDFYRSKNIKLKKKKEEVEAQPSAN